MYKLLYHPAVEKFLRKLTKDEARRIIEKIESVAIDPYTPNSNIKKMADSTKSSRLRVGKIRIIFEIDSRNQILYILTADFRGNIY